VSASRDSGLVVWIVIAVGALVVGLGLGAGLMYTLAPSGPPQGAGGPPGGGPPGDGGPPPASVVVEPAIEMPLRQRFAVVGRLREVRRARLAAAVEGKLIEMPADAGDAVVAGQTVVARIEDTWAKLAVRQLEAEVAAARAELDQAQRDLDYLSSLASSSAANPKEVADARAEVARESARLAAAEAARDLAKEQLTRVEVRAPFTGTVVAKHAELGEWMQEGDPLVGIVSSGEIDAVVDVPEQFINQVELGSAVELLLDAKTGRRSGAVVAINPDGDNAARTYAVKMRLDDEGGRLKAGMSVTALIPLEAQTPRITVPRDAVQYAAGVASVWVAAAPAPNPTAAGPGNGGPAPNGPPMPVATSVPVTVLFGHGGRFAVEPAPSREPVLVDGADVVVQGAEMIFFPGQPLVLAQAPGESGAQPGMDMDAPASAAEPGQASAASPTEPAGRP